MSITWNDLTVNIERLDKDGLISDWRWLVGDAAQPILISSTGDAYLQERNGEVFLLSTGDGTYEKVADSYEDFRHKLRDTNLVNECFLAAIVAQLKEQGLVLKPGMLYSFKELPVLGGDYVAENFELADIEVHFSITGQVHKQVKDIPAGEAIQLNAVWRE
ncbi:DUF1851 domain-containing protein [Hahella sp. CR1]|uniref:T6SS immunity protein Tdi1 domain-containing protein n=1 Tax=Hahella sp. CR1 TaxID=2992807 RepID=UPI002442DEF6|nr:T6SS immunity protein Tdi1 domain-containing protein [Hahella sp. CR1]MDG9667919.1 DUF1851 domain-containing protein [Hahella sp. CR1]